jgi:hypothetical protein
MGSTLLDIIVTIHPALDAAAIIIVMRQGERLKRLTAALVRAGVIEDPEEPAEVKVKARASTESEAR